MKEEYYFWPADLLARYVVKAHHQEMLHKLSEIKVGFTQLAMMHNHCPKLSEAHTLFLQCAHDMEAHFSKEAIAVLAITRRYKRALEQGKESGKPGLYSVCPSIHQMYLEHKSEMLRFKLLWHLMSQVSVKDSPLYDTTCQQLCGLQSQWQVQVRLENDILFPKIIDMEAQLIPL